MTYYKYNCLLVSFDPIKEVWTILSLLKTERRTPMLSLLCLNLISMGYSFLVLSKLIYSLKYVLTTMYKVLLLSEAWVDRIVIAVCFHMKFQLIKDKDACVFTDYIKFWFVFNLGLAQTSSGITVGSHKSESYPQIYNNLLCVHERMWAWYHSLLIPQCSCILFFKFFSQTLLTSTELFNIQMR